MKIINTKYYQIAGLIIRINYHFPVKDCFLDFYPIKYFLITNNNRKFDFTMDLIYKKEISLLVKKKKDYYSLIFKQVRASRVVINTFSTVDFNLVFKFILDQILFDKNIYFLHSSSVILNNKAILFMGKSGAGKTTVIKMLKKDRKSTRLNSSHT